MVDLYLRHPVSKEVLELDLPHQMKGGTYALGGTTEAHLNVTYNYSVNWNKAFNGKHLRDIDGMTGANSIPFLKAGIAALNDDMDEDYWKPTEGNTKSALIQLLALAAMRPDGVWSVS